MASMNLLTLGSSPHARGALKRISGKLVVERIIPACAGSTRCSFSDD